MRDNDNNKDFAAYAGALNRPQITRFAIVGGLTAVIYYGVLYMLVEFAGRGVLLSSSAAYLTAIIFNYNLHHGWTFQAQVAHNVASTRYLLMCVVGFCINYVVMLVGVDADEGNYLLVQTIAVACVVSWNFVISSFWVYRE